VTASGCKTKQKISGKHLIINTILKHIKKKNNTHKHNKLQLSYIFWSQNLQLAKEEILQQFSFYRYEFNFLVMLKISEQSTLNMFSIGIILPTELKVR